MNTSRLRAVADVLMRMDRLHEDAAELCALIDNLDTVRGEKRPPQTDGLLNTLEGFLGELGRVRNRICGIIVDNVVRGEPS